MIGFLQYAMRQFDLLLYAFSKLLANQMLLKDLILFMLQM